MVKIYYFISACLLLFSCNNCNTQVSSFDDSTATISSIKRDTIVEKDTIAPIQVPKEETDEATKMILEFYDKYIRQQDKILCSDSYEEEKKCEDELIRIKKNYLSNKLIKKIKPTEDRDMDFILNAQDIYIEWLDSIKVKKINSKRYNVYLFDFYENRYDDSIQLKVAKKKDRYIIDDIIF
ncbi:DUF3828 domain-containing protein [Capnocytophaga genosp. AHN8471]|uniref:DUF3828 domain-containing protein n=1 Tax=Capnocytophaga endodontalis TaxID=2708117 RepID=A0A1Z4BRS6_9FLAO|nr:MULTISPECIES: DUF3828 domain-containing protein [Capnocytophaga]ASF44004.1 DUF3828 domain-containing protein [Capnocytophaga endodontalis]MBM0657595.1 DUF3828 domain-containing protein [Capnocytophaga genosp. AHN8471]